MCKLPLANYIILGIMCAVMIPFAVLGILRLAEVGSMFSYNPTFDIVAVVVEVVITVGIVLLTFLTRYVVTDKYFIFQRIIPTKIPINNLLLIRHELSEDIMVLYISDSAAPAGVRILVLRVFAKQKRDIVQAIQAANPTVAYEMFDNSRKEDHD